MSEERMYCKKCCTEVPNEDKFCSKCGTEVEGTHDEYICQTKPKKSLISKKLMWGIIGLLVVGIIIFIVYQSRTSTSRVLFELFTLFQITRT
jgi:uncharacterized membrane protein YvbJ